jgi:hypothetical protein
MNNSQPPATWYNPRISTYWFCFAIAFGLFALIPVWTISTPNTPEPQKVILATAYLAPHRLPWRHTLVVHTMAATLAAAIGTIVLHRTYKNNQVVRTFTIRLLLVLTVLAALAAAVLRHFSIDPLVVGCALFPILVYPLACFLAIKLRS